MANVLLAACSSYPPPTVGQNCHQRLLNIVTHRLIGQCQCVCCLVQRLEIFMATAGFFLVSLLKVSTDSRHCEEGKASSWLFTQDSSVYVKEKIFLRFPELKKCARFRDKVGYKHRRHGA